MECNPKIKIRWLWVQNRYPKMGALVNGTKDSNMRCPSGFILTHTHMPLRDTCLAESMARVPLRLPGLRKSHSKSLTRPLLRCSSKKKKESHLRPLFFSPRTEPSPKKSDAKTSEARRPLRPGPRRPAAVHPGSRWPPSPGGSVSRKRAVNAPRKPPKW